MIKEVSRGDFNSGVGLEDGEKVIIVEGVSRELNTFYRHVTSTLVSAIEFRDRFTFEERVLIDSSTKPEVMTFRKDLELRQRPVDLTSSRFALAMTLLLSEGLIQAGRDLVILETESLNIA